MICERRVYETSKDVTSKGGCIIHRSQPVKQHSDDLRTWDISRISLCTAKRKVGISKATS
jgi:hypothetical protein